MMNTESFLQGEWRQTGSYQPSMRSSSQPIQDVLPSPTVSASRKKQKTSQSVQSLPGLSSVKSAQYPAGAAGGRHLTSRSSFNARPSNASAEAATSDPLIGKKVWTRWPEDNHFYEAVITDYNPAEGRHALVYDISTPSETWEWVNLKEISPEDIRWDEDPGIPHRGGPGGQGHGVKKSFSRTVDTMVTGRGRGHPKAQPRKEYHLPQNGIVKRVLDDFELLNTELLVKEVERVFAVNHPDPTELEKAKNMLKEHEQALIDAIARLADTSDGESDGEHPLLDGQLMETG
ncbi:protein EMSY-LIKE 1 isoform X2 [Neltuma alba]|uniref:protein EMSY-LIKE 1 isoform X2 n=1 Tax=Neltuma alba TaxID=207710 RepID=UPI0010A3B3F7|nr:protein EMSY-LIKE 1-like isoform X2 [Prosopis alba]XP_028790010.1 protein EMSY-LIKE 1-like isoform X2 [Prosopis alba]